MSYLPVVALTKAHTQGDSTGSSRICDILKLDPPRWQHGPGYLLIYLSTYDICLYSVTFVADSLYADEGENAQQQDNMQVAAPNTANNQV